MQIVCIQFVRSPPVAREEMVEKQNAALTHSQRYHDDAQLSQPGTETESEIVQNAMMVVTPGQSQEKARSGTPKLAFSFLLTYPSHRFGFVFSESILHLNWETIYVSFLGLAIQEPVD